MTNKNFLWVNNTNLNISGLDKDSRLGNKVSISSNGKILAISENTATSQEGIDYAGRIRVISLEDKNKPKVVLISEGEEKGAFFGNSMKLSANGKYLIAGEQFFNNNLGKINIFDIDKQESNIIYGEFEKENFGFDVALNKDASIVVITSSYYKPPCKNNLEHQGGIKVFRRDIENSYQKIADIKDENFSAQNIVINEDGSIFFVSERCFPVNNSNFNDFGSRTSFDSIECEGCIKSYRYDTNSGTYKFFGGPPIPGSNLDAFSSHYSISISSSGLMFLVGDKTFDNNKGRVRIFRFNSDLEIWELAGLNSEFLGLNNDQFLGSSVAMDSTGNTIVFCDNMVVKTYSFKNNTWIQMAQEISVSSEDNSIALSADNSTLIIGEPTFDNKGLISFYEKIYSNGENDVCLFDNTHLTNLDSDIASLVREDNKFDILMDMKDEVSSVIKSMSTFSERSVKSDKLTTVTILKTNGEVFQTKEMPSKVKTNCYKVVSCKDALNLSKPENILYEVKNNKKNAAILVMVLLAVLVLILAIWIWRRYSKR